MNGTELWSLTCKTCGTPFECGHKRAYCSPKCRAKYIWKGTERNCRACNKAFMSRQKEKAYCSLDCQFKARGRGPYNPRLSQCKHCKANFMYGHKNRKLYCSKACHNKHNGFKKWTDPIQLEQWRAARRKRRALLRGQSYSEQEIFERDSWCCGICGKKVDRSKIAPHPMAPSIDHILPVSLGGLDEPSNVQCAHLRCNVVKFNRTGYQRRLWG